MKKFSLTLLAIGLSLSLMAQSTGNPDFLRSTGKIYVVVAVIISVLLGIFLYLFYIERKLAKVEREIANHE